MIYPSSVAFNRCALCRSCRSITSTIALPSSVCEPCASIGTALAERPAPLLRLNVAAVVAADVAAVVAAVARIALAVVEEPVAAPVVAVSVLAVALGRLARLHFVDTCVPSGNDYRSVDSLRTAGIVTVVIHTEGCIVGIC